MASTTPDNAAHHSPLPSALPLIPEPNDPLDLLNVFAIILRRKFTVLTFIIVAVLIAVAVCFIMPQRWTSKAVLVPAEPSQLKNINNILTELSVLHIKTDITPDSLLSDFMRNFDSQSLREKYLVNTDYFKNLASKKTNDAESRNRLIYDILHGNIESHSSVQDKEANKKEYRYYDLKYTAETAVDARDLLEGYINYIAGEVNEELYRRLQYKIDEVRLKEKALYDLEMKQEELKHRNRIERLQYALDIASSAGLKSPSWSNGGNIHDDPDYPVTLGADGLARKLEIEKSLTIGALNDKLQNQRLYIEKLDAVKILPTEDLPFKYMRAPYEPIIRDAPKRTLIVLLFSLAGLIAGCGYVLVSSVMVRRSY
ncbi:LPS O-antigen length regulator Wzz(fepE) [Erwiniaceae bacterium CAU 1747]